MSASPSAPVIDPADLERLTEPDRLWAAEKLERRAVRAAQGKPHSRIDAQLERRLGARLAAARARALQAPDLGVAGELPVAASADEIVEALRGHRVVVVAGDTGSGKSTQLPKVCMAAGLGRRGMIGHTQPRRLAARTLASRLASETGTEGSDCIAFQVRFADTSGPGTRVKLMTDGILMQELTRDPLLSAYDALIVDEAHERSLNIDFILGHLRRVLERRQDLRVVVTSATIDVERFAAFFGTEAVFRVSGRTYPVEVRYRPALRDGGGTADLSTQVIEALDEIAAHERAGGGSPRARDVLVFLPGEREIRDLARDLRGVIGERGEVLPLYARLSPAEQQRVFRPGKGRRVVLATNVAETSITVPGIGYVIDSGLVRTSRYDYRAKLQRLPVEPVSRASAAQRAGRCGRVAPGLCIRLYAEEDFLGRPEFTDPEIRRTNLAAVILQMRSAGLGDPATFPFLDPPEPGALGDGERLLRELLALDPDGALTSVGRTLARLPVDPRLGRMLQAAAGSGAVREALVIVSGLAVQDPRLRPLEQRGAADEAHRAWQDERSDFLSWVRLWDAVETQRQALTASRFRRWCERRFLSVNHLREWRETHRQLKLVLAELGRREQAGEADYEVLHRALLTGSLGLIGQRTDEGDYLGARGRRFRLARESALAPAKAPWIMVAELVETRQVRARTAARIEPGWLEEAGAHLLRHHHGEPYWDEKRGEALVSRRSTLYGLPVVEGRRVPLDRVDPEGARALFVQAVLVEGRTRLDLPFQRHNDALRRRIRQEEEALRRRDVVADDALLVRFFEERLPAEVTGVASLKRWLARGGDGARLQLDEGTVRAREATELTADDYPSSLRVGEHQLRVRYRFSPGAEDDGASLQIPVEALDAVDEDFCSWPVPGFLEPLVGHLLRGQPKALRKRLAPVQETAEAAARALRPGALERREPLLARLVTVVRAHRGVELDSAALARALDADVPPGLRLNLQLRGDRKRLLAQGRSVAALRGTLAQRSAMGDRGEIEALERRGITTWDFGALPDHRVLRDGRVLYPALEDRSDGVDLRWLPERAPAQRATARGVTRLVLLSQRQSVRHLERREPALKAAALRFAPRMPGDALVDGVLRLVVRDLLGDDGWPRDEAGFAAACARVGPALVPRVRALADHLEPLAGLALDLARRLEGLDSPAFRDARADAQRHFDRLFPPNWLDLADGGVLEVYPEYLAGIGHRLDHLQGNVERDARLAAEMQRLEARYEQLCRRAGVLPWDTPRSQDPELWAVRWDVEAVRLALFAETRKLRRGPGAGMSAKKLGRRLGALERAVEASGAVRRP